jgi:signal transduction histidine kinase
MSRSSLAFRLVASAAVWCALLLSAGGYGLSALFADTVQRTFDARLLVLLEGLIAGSEIDAQGKLELRLQLGEPRFEQPFSGWFWQISDGERPLARSASLWDQQLPVPPASVLEATGSDAAGPGGRAVRLVARAIILPGRDAPLTYVVAGDRSEITRESGRFNRLLAIALGVLFVGLIGAILIQVLFGLEPLRRMRRALAAIRTGEARRLSGDFPSEIEPLAVELNALIDHSERLVERARTHVGNLAHGLKTPLAVLTNEAGRAEGPLAELALRQVALMRRQVDHHLARARAAAAASILGARTEVLPVLRDLERTLQRIHFERQLSIEIACPASLSFRGARQDLEEMLGNLMDNACKWARGRVSVEAASIDHAIAIAIEDDGDGLPEGLRADVLERGRRLDETKPGSGLGLAIVTDLAELYGGQLELGSSALGGLAAHLTLPAPGS